MAAAGEKIFLMPTISMIPDLSISMCIGTVHSIQLVTARTGHQESQGTRGKFTHNTCSNTCIPGDSDQCYIFYYIGRNKYPCIET